MTTRSGPQLLDPGTGVARWLAIGLLTPALWGRPGPARRALWAAYAYLGAQEMASRLVVLRPPGRRRLRWNWAGKSQELLLGLGAWVALGGGSRRRAPAAAHAVGAAAVAALVALAARRAQQRELEPWDAETVAFQATMPGLAEEVTWRGVIQDALGRATAPAGAVALTGWWFLLSHALLPAPGAPYRMLPWRSVAAAFALPALRAWPGVPLPYLVAAHNAANFLLRPEVER